MARKLRDEEAGAVHHVYNRGNDKQLIYRDDGDRHGYLALLGLVTRWTGWRCMAYCLMDNHMHLLVETPKPNLGKGMQRLHGKYGREFNDSHLRSGHVFQGRFRNKRVVDERQFWTVVRYIVRNPVEAGMCERPGDWAWSSHACALAATGPSWLDLGRLFEYFGSEGGDPSARYRELVDGSAEEALESLALNPQPPGTTPFG